MKAVDNEYKMGLSNEFRAEFQIEKSHVSIPGSQLNRFSCGSLETLQVPNILDELKRFYTANYSSNLMNLVLVSRLGLDELQKLATEKFCGVENRKIPAKNFSNELVFDKKHSFGKIFKIIPEKHLKMLTLTWVMPASQKHDTKKSSCYLSHVFGHEGPNSLLSQLIKLNLATELAAGGSDRLN